MYGDFQQWQRETGLTYDQVLGDFYRALTAEDKQWLASLHVAPFGDGRAWRRNSGL